MNSSPSVAYLITVTVLIVTFLPQFVDPTAGKVAIQFVILGVCYVALEIAVDGTVGVIADVSPDSSECGMYAETSMLPTDRSISPSA